ncbi:protein adenylyltransferase SelO [Metabacillus endolithicus]|uniref:protein adenylyltransferase SelO n=1 Tax=Metabacillus endolithicus TaxID=1535204 RepID=UPI001FF85C61|nr:YdiU family protein [Metabacillus endolithicus]UPG62000.1 YdiU family protein [Metabacillus endolithicus]
MTKEQDLKTGWKIDNSYARLPKKFFTEQKPTPVSNPELIIQNDQLASSLGLNVEELRSHEQVEVFAGNRIPEGSTPLAQAYAGHQFGHLNMLGDGRAVLLGEQVTPQDERVDIQLKGSGRTPYSRGGDGSTALGPMLREYIISEAMYALGIPTTRSLAVITTGENILRETELPGAILTRVAASHIRVGTFQFAAQLGTDEELQALADYTIERHYPEIERDDNRYLSLLQQMIHRQASLIAKWQLVGFIHGVMNTDNMTVSGETIDYGPCAFMDTYDPETVFSSIDVQGRYAYGNQPFIGGWNLARFAESLIPLLHEDQDRAVEIAQEEISKYMDIYETNWLRAMRAKLGLFSEEKDDKTLIDDLLTLMHKHKADYTNTFVAITFDKWDEMELFRSSEFEQWKERWHERLTKQKESKEESQKLMRDHNPAVIPRNHRVEEALEAAVKHGDYTVMERLLDALTKPFAHTTQQEEYCSLPPKSGQPYRTYCGT